MILDWKAALWIHLWSGSSRLLCPVPDPEPDVAPGRGYPQDSQRPRILHVTSGHVEQREHTVYSEVSSATHCLWLHFSRRVLWVLELTELTNGNSNFS